MKKGQPAAFHVTYQGPALENGEMDVRELAPALLALSDIFEEANHILNGDKTDIQLKVVGSFKTGSFAIDFSVVQGFYGQLVDMFSGNTASAADNLLGLLGFVSSSTMGLVQLIKYLKNRTIKKVEIQGNNKAIIILDDEQIEVEREVIKFLQSKKIRDGLEEAIEKPLRREGIDSFSSSSDPSSDPIMINSDAAAFFQSPKIVDQEIGQSTTERKLSLANIDFREDHKWKLTDGQSIFHVTVEDERFLKLVQSNRASFTKGDILTVRLRAEEFDTEKGIRTNYYVEKIIDHSSAYKQVPLPLVFTDDEDS
jgi:hypothetical protein